MPARESALLVEFARTCKAAARNTSLYPATHPAIGGSVARVAAASANLTAEGSRTLTIHPDTIMVEGRTPARPDPVIGELARLLHERLIGELRLEPGAGTADWLAFLLLLGRTPDELVAAGGIGKAWTESGGRHFEIHEIDYTEVLREREGANAAQWDEIIAYCLREDWDALDEDAILALIAAFDDPDRLGAFLDRLLKAPSPGGVSAGSRAAAFVQLLLRLHHEAASRDPQDGDRLLDSVAKAAPRFTPEVLLALLDRGRISGPDAGHVVGTILHRMGTGGIASFVAHAVTSERSATERLAEAFSALVPDQDQKAAILEDARAEAQQGPLGSEPEFENLWRSAAEMLSSYTDEHFVSGEYGRELSRAREQAIEVEKVFDDPPERIQEWIATVSEASLRVWDLSLVLDLLRLENDPAQWQGMATVAIADVERLVAQGDFATARQLTDAIVREAGSDGRVPLRTAAEESMQALTKGPLVLSIANHFRTAEEENVEALGRLCHSIGAGLAKPMAEVLAVEENNRTIRRLRELLLGFGASGRQAVEQLKGSPNPAIRRMAVDLLRLFGGHAALPELASMLSDLDPQVQRESIRAIVHIGSDEAYAVLKQALIEGRASRDTMVRQLISLRDDKAIPLLCYILGHSTPRGALFEVHVQIIETLGGSSPHPESTRTLQRVLHRTEWWAPLRTATLRQAAAVALRRIGSPDALAVLREAAERGPRGVKSAARTQVSLASAQGRDQA